MIDIRIPARPAHSMPKTRRPPQNHNFKYASEGFVPRKFVMVVNNAGGGYKVPAKMPKY